MLTDHRYFLFQATLIPVHCLRCAPSSPLAPSWRSQIESSLVVFDDMRSMNSSSAKCHDVIISLCGAHLSNYNRHRAASGNEGGTVNMADVAGGADAAMWMAGSAPTVINADIWLGSLDNNGDWDGSFLEGGSGL